MARSHGPGRPPEGPEGEGVSSPAAWQTALERILRYLKALGVPPLESLGIAREILEPLVAEEDSPATSAAVGAAMQRLHRLLEARWSAPPPPAPAGGDAEPEAVGGASDLPDGLPALARRLLQPYRHVRAAPPLARGAMPAGDLSRRPSPRMANGA